MVQDLSITNIVKYSMTLYSFCSEEEVSSRPVMSFPQPNHYHAQVWYTGARTVQIIVLLKIKAHFNVIVFWKDCMTSQFAYWCILDSLFWNVFL